MSGTLVSSPFSTARTRRAIFADSDIDGFIDGALAESAPIEAMVPIVEGTVQVPAFKLAGQERTRRSEALAAAMLTVGLMVVLAIAFAVVVVVLFN